MSNKLTATDIVAAIQAKNAAFNALPKAQRRVIIAQDTIFQLWSGKYEAASGTYFDLFPEGDEKFVPGTELQTLINTPGLTCEVCARGAIFASAVRLTNELKIGLNDTESVDMGALNPAFRAKESKFFPWKQLLLMEFAFEVDPGSSDEDLQCEYDCRDEEDHATEYALKFGRRYKNDAKRLMAIMQNVIDNDGTFKPEIKTKPLKKAEFFARYEPFTAV
jgi:hypothetical protein